MNDLLARIGFGFDGRDKALMAQPVDVDPTLGVDRDLKGGFFAHAVTVENPTSRFLYVHSAGIFVAPYSSRTVPLPGTQKARLVWRAPDGIAQPGIVAGEIAFAIFWRDPPVIAVGGAQLASGTVVAGTVTANQGTPAVAANRWPTELYTGLTAYDARQIRALTSADQVTALQGTTPWNVGGSAGAYLQQRAGTLDLYTQLRTAGTEYDARQVRALTSADVVTAAQGAPAVAANRWPVELYAGLTAYDARQIRALTTADAVNVGQWIGSAAPTVGQKTMANSLPFTLASDQSVFPAVAEQRAATLHVTATAAVNTALTATLPAAGVGLFHYITSIQLHKLYSVVGVANGAGVIVTSTNLPGGPAWTTEQLALAAGSVTKVIDYQPTTPLKCTAANTPTTFVAPQQLQTIWRWNVSYFTAA